MLDHFPRSKPQEAYFPIGVKVNNCKQFFFFGHLVLGLASGLEAFSREPPCGSIGALVVRRTPETRGMAWEFLSYYPILPSRYLRDPSTISDRKVHFYIGKRHSQGYAVCLRPKNDPSSLCAIIISRNSQLSRVKPTCLTTV